MRVADYIAGFLADNGVDTVYMVAGGGMMFLSDGLACSDRLRVVCNHHEQASAMAAVAHAKYKGIGCAYFTTGCGGSNAVTGVLHAWQDSTPVLFISGQCKRKETTRNARVPLRQVGVQEADIARLVEPICKYAVMVNEAEEIRYHMEKALYLAKSGRPGPVWVDVPMDVQSARIEPRKLAGFTPPEQQKREMDFSELRGDLARAERPVVIAGQGVRLSGAVGAFEDFVRRNNLPFVCARLGLDVLPTTDDLYTGRIGNKGTRAANFAVQNADLVLVLGSRLSVSSTGHEYGLFAPDAKVVVVDIDEVEHQKDTVKIDRFYGCDLRDFFPAMEDFTRAAPEKWAAKCREWKARYPVFDGLPPKDSAFVDVYLFVQALSECLEDDDVIVADTGSALFASAQGIQLRSKGQRYIASGAQVEMGFTLPGVIGACFASGRRAIGLTGDGSLQMNLQELQTIVHHSLPVKLFVWNNQGYLSIRTTQNKYFDGRFMGSDARSGVSMPDLSKIAAAYGIRYVRADNPDRIRQDIRFALDHPNAVICEIMCDPAQEIIPTVSAKVLPDGTLVSTPIDDMYPFLPEEEYRANHNI